MSDEIMKDGDWATFSGQLGRIVSHQDDVSVVQFYDTGGSPCVSMRQTGTARIRTSDLQRVTAPMLLLRTALTESEETVERAESVIREHRARLDALRIALAIAMPESAG